MNSLTKERRLGFIEGQIQGIRDYAIWKNGEQKVGCLEKPLKEVLAPLHAELDRLHAIDVNFED